MKNILLAIDFSKHAYNAAYYAAELAKHTGARLILFHAYNHSVSETGNGDDEVQHSEKKAQDKLDALARKLKSLNEISITRLLKPGNVVEETLYVANKIKTDLIVLGVAKTTKQYHPVLDALTTEIIDKSNLPVMLIPPKASFRSFEHVFLALGENEAAHDISNFKFLNKLFFKFREAKLLTLQLISTGSVANNKMPDELPVNPSSGSEQNREALEAKTTGNPAISQQEHMQLLVQAYATAGNMISNLKKNTVPFTEAIPVLLIPAYTL